MPTACITQPQCRIGLCSERLEVTGRNDETGRDELLRAIPLRDLDRLIVHDGVQITSAALAALLQGGIPISFLGSLGQYLGGFQPAANHHGEARLSQYTRTLDAAFALSISGRIIAAKIYNQRRVLQRLAATRSLSLERELVWFQGILAQTGRSSTLDELRGFEGVSTARYFQLWERFLPAAFPFETRSTRPPKNPVNACISFTATLVYTEMVSAIHAHGLDPALGLLHSTENGRWSLALDLMEPFRPVLVEALTLDLFNHQILGSEHFEPQKGGVYLNNAGRKKLLLQFERRMERQFLSEHAGCRTTLRQQLEQQVTDLKRALDDPALFEPFLIN